METKSKLIKVLHEIDELEKTNEVKRIALFVELFFFECLLNPTFLEKTDEEQIDIILSSQGMTDFKESSYEKYEEILKKNQCSKFMFDKISSYSEMKKSHILSLNSKVEISQFIFSESSEIRNLLLSKYDPSGSLLADLL